MFFKTFLLQLPYFILTFLITMPDIRILADNAGGFRQDNILIEFLSHTNPNFKAFPEIFLENYDVVVKGQRFDNMWVDSNNKRVVKTGAFNILNEKIFEIVKAQSENKGETNGTKVIRDMKTLLKNAKLLRKRESDDRFIIICDTVDLADFFLKCQYDACIADMDITRENQCLILYKRTSGMYPTKENINCKNWDEIQFTIPTAVASSATADVVTNTANIAASMGKMAQDARTNLSAKSKRRNVLNYRVLPQEVQDQVADRLRNVPICFSDIFNPDYSRRVYNNEFTEDVSNGVGVTGVRRDMLHIEFPDRQWSGSDGKLTELWHHHIPVGGYVVLYINVMSSDDDKLFRKCINKVEKWNVHSNYFFYQDLYDKGTSLGIWLLPWTHFKRGVRDPRGFATGDAC